MKFTDGTEVTETKRAVKPMRVTCDCPQVGCAGHLVFNGNSFTQWDTTYDHECSMCGLKRGIVNRKYPHIEYAD